MQKLTRITWLFGFVIMALGGVLARASIVFQDPTSLMNVSFFGMYRPEAFAWVYPTLLNKEESNDRFGVIRQTCDLGVNLTDANTITEFNFVVRNKGIWGNPGSIARTNPKPIKILDAAILPQSFEIPRHIFWMREAWLRFNLGKLFSLPFDAQHYFTLGAFPFSLGRGISLGDAYAVGPRLLGFYSDTVVDQYAFGFLFSGDMVKDVLDYSLYGALLQNKSDSLGSTSEKINAQHYNRRANAARGFGVLNFLFAGNMNWYPVKDEKYGSLRLQPYWLYNQDDEQSIDIAGDARGKLVTLGLEVEYLGDRIQVNIEGAINLGHQTRCGIDHNVIELKSIDGRVSQVNSHVVDKDKAKVPFVADSDAQQAIYKVDPSQSANRQQIPGDYPQIGFLFPPDGEIFNSADRFSDGYTNQYKGFMCVADAAMWVYKKDLKVAAAVGVASGDLNPNFDNMDRDYQGFIDLQSIYSGKWVRSAFFLGGHGKVVRPIANPTQDEETNSVTEAVSGFTNLILGGLGLTWTPTDWEKPLKINPNCLFYWQYQSVPVSPLNNPYNGPTPLANSFLGVELNLFMDYNVVKNLKVYSVTSFFIPGQFYRDIAGRRDVLIDTSSWDEDDLTGFVQDDIPKFGHDMAMTFNFGIDYRF